MQQAFDEIRGGLTIFDFPIVQEPIAHVFEHAHGGLEVAVGGLVLCRAVSGMELRKIRDLLPSRRVEFNTFVVMLIAVTVETRVLPMLKTHEDIGIAPVLVAAQLYGLLSSGHYGAREAPVKPRGYLVPECV